MSGEVKLGEAGKDCYLCQISYVKYPGKAFWCLQPFQSLLLLENAEKIHQKSYLAIMNNSRTYIYYHV